MNEFHILDLDRFDQLVYCGPEARSLQQLRNTTVGVRNGLDYLRDVRRPIISARHRKQVQQHTDLQCIGIADGLNLRHQVQLPSRGLDDDEQALLAALAMECCNHPFLRVRISVGQNVQFKLVGTDCRIKIFEVQLLEKLKETPARSPKRLQLKVGNCGSAPRSLRLARERVLRKEGAGWILNDIAKWVSRLADSQLKADNIVLEGLGWKIASTPIDAEVKFNKEIEKRLTRASLACTKPFHYRFHTLPEEVRCRIWFYAMFKDQVEGSRVYPFRYCSENYFLHYRSSESAPNALQLQLANRQISAEASRVLYSLGIWQFHTPRKLAEVIKQKMAHQLVRIKHLELWFDSEVMLRFLQPHVGVRFLQDSKILEKLKVDIDVDSFLAFISKKGHPNLTLIIRLPRRERRLDARVPSGCHVILCKWIVKAWETALIQYPGIRKRMRYLNDLHEARSSTWQAQSGRELDDILRLQRNPNHWTWEQLIEDAHLHSSLIYDPLQAWGPPLCKCPAYSDELERLGYNGPDDPHPDSSETFFADELRSRSVLARRGYYAGIQ